MAMHCLEWPKGTEGILAIAGSVGIPGIADRVKDLVSLIKSLLLLGLILVPS